MMHVLASDSWFFSWFQKHSKIGMWALEDFIPSLLAPMDARSLNRLIVVFSVRSQEHLIPKLLSKLLTQWDADALGSVGHFAPNAARALFGSIILASLSDLSSDDANAAMKETIRIFLCHISKFVDVWGMSILVSEVTSKARSAEVTIRVDIC